MMKLWSVITLLFAFGGPVTAWSEVRIPMPIDVDLPDQTNTSYRLLI